MAKQGVFLKARWENLLMANYRVDPDVLKPYIPPGTELDHWHGDVLVSMVGFLFHDTKVFGVKWPFHTHFEEVNLRFYVRYLDGETWKRGAVFISEIVPKPLIAFFANTLFNEKYTATAMRHLNERSGGEEKIRYQWKHRGRWNTLGAMVSTETSPIVPGSAEEFIFDHYWGYNRVSDTKTMEYAVEHPVWRISAAQDLIFDSEISSLYGPAFAPYLSAPPVSVFFARGSDVLVRKGRLLHKNQG